MGVLKRVRKLRDRLAEAADKAAELERNLGGVDGSGPTGNLPGTGAGILTEADSLGNQSESFVGGEGAGGSSGGDGGLPLNALERANAPIRNAIAEGTQATNENSEAVTRQTGAMISELRLLGDRIERAVGRGSGPFDNTRNQRRRRV